MYPDGATCEVDGAGKLTVLGTTGSTNASEIQGIAVSATTPTTGQVLEYNGTEYVPTTPSITSSITAHFGTADPNGANTPASVQSASAGGGSVALSSSVTEGNLLVVVFSIDTYVPGRTCTDTLGTSYTQLENLSTPEELDVWAGIAPASGTNTVTISGSMNYRPAMTACEFSNATISVDQSITSSDHSSMAGPISVTTAAPNDLVLACVGSSSGGSATVSSGFTQLSDQEAAYNQNVTAVAYSVETSPASVSASFSLPSTGAWCMALIALKAISDPVSGTEGDLYFQTSSSPYTSYVLHSGAWQPFS
jgi:hypothetical protein